MSRICEQKFNRKSELDAHYLRLHDVTNWKQCPHCKKYFKSLNTHINEIHRNITYTCDQCELKFSTLRSLRRHVKLTHIGQVERVEKESTCIVCGINVLHRKLNSHVELHHLLPDNLRVPCPVCQASVKFLPFHLKKCHGQLNIRRDLYPCRKCGRYFVDAEQLSVHQAYHQMYPCSLCNKVFNRFLDLGWHFLNHHRLVFNPGSSSRRSKRGPREEDVNIDVSKLQLYSFDRHSIDGQTERLKEIEIDVYGNGAINKVLVYLSDQNEEDLRDLSQDRLHGASNDDKEGKESCLVAQDHEETYADSMLDDSSQNTEIVLAGQNCTKFHYLEGFSEEADDEVVETNLIVVIEDDDHSQQFHKEFELPDEHISPFQAQTEYGLTAQTKIIEPVSPQNLESNYRSEPIRSKHRILSDTSVENTERFDTLLECIESQETREDDVLVVESFLNASEERTRKDPSEEDNTSIQHIFKSKFDIPRNLRNTPLRDADEKILKNIAGRLDSVRSKDLRCLQISETPVPEDSEVRSKKNRHRFFDSRQAHVCPHCRSILKTRDSLKNHIATQHLDVKPHSCEHCLKRFLNRSDLKKHVDLVHCTNNLVECDICLKKVKKSYFKRHKEATHGVKVTTKCDVCAKAFKSRQIMLQHRRKFHN